MLMYSKKIRYLKVKQNLFISGRRKHQVSMGHTVQLRVEMILNFKFARNNETFIYIYI